MEPRRVEMVTFAQQNQPKSEKVDPTIRFTLTLAESNDETCPEFSYAELWKNALDEKEQDENDPFSRSDRAEEDKMATMAKSFEAKYGPPPSRKKNHRRSDRMQDLVDLGDGYDETDPFVDNSEAYDELVPASVTTKHGGFYINAGCLDFRALSDDSIDAFKEQKHRKKHRILSDSESEGVIKKKQGPKKKKLLEGNMGDEMKKRKWKRPASDAAKNFIRRKKLKAKELASAAQSLPAPSPPVVGQNGFSHVRKNIITSDSSDDDSNSALGTETSSILDPETSAKYESVIDSVISQASPDETEEKPGMDSEESIPKLPSPLSNSLLEAIAKIKQAAKESAEGKCKFFNLRVNELLLQIENESRQLVCGVRMAIYAHLAGHLPCGKETLVKRAKKLRLNQQDHKLREPLARLREAVSHVMPALLETHQAECLVTAQAKERLSESKDKIEGVRESGSAESEEDTERSQDGTGERQKRIVAPRRKFTWNTEIRNLLCNVVRIKMECFELSKIRSQLPEEYLRAFLDAEVKPLWPQGWMQTRMLFKETRSVHMRWTNPALLKPKKIMLLPPTTKVNTQTPGVGTSDTVGEPLHVFTGPTPVLNKPNTTPVLKTNERPPGGKCEEAEEAMSPPRSAPTLLDYASQSFMSAARSKTLSSGANESNSDSSMLSPSMPRLKPEKPVPPLDSRTAFLDHFKAFTQQQLINKAKSLVKPGAVTNVPQGGATVEMTQVAPQTTSVRTTEYAANQTEKRHIASTAPPCSVNNTSTKTSPTNLPRVISPLSVSPLKNVTPPKQVVAPSDHLLSPKELAHVGDRLSPVELANLLMMAGNKSRRIAPPSERLLIPKQIEHVSERLSSAEISNLLKVAVTKRKISTTTSQGGASTGPTDGSTVAQVATPQVKLATVPGKNTSWQQQPQQGYLSSERSISGQPTGVQNTDLKHRSPPCHRSPVGARQTDVASIVADAAKEHSAKFGSMQPRRLSDVGQCHDVRDIVLTSGEKKRQPVSLCATKPQRQCSVGHDQVPHSTVAPPSGVVRQTMQLQRSLSQEPCSKVAPSGGAERHASVSSSGQQKRRSSVNHGPEMHHAVPPGGKERQTSVSPGVCSQSGASVNREQRTNIDRRRLSLTPPTSASSQQRSPSMYGSPSSPRQQHGCDRLSHIGGATPRQQPTYGGLSLTEAHQQVLAANQKSYVKQALAMAPPESRSNHGDAIPLSLTSSTCSSPLYWSTPLSHTVAGSPRTSLPSPVFTGLSGDRGASIIATTASMFSLPGDMPPMPSIGYHGLNLPKASPPHLSHPPQQHPAMHLNGSPDHITGSNLFGHASTPHGSPLLGHNAQGMTSQHGSAHCYNPRHPQPPMPLAFGNPFSDPNQPQHRY